MRSEADSIPLRTPALPFLLKHPTSLQSLYTQALLFYTLFIAFSPTALYFVLA
jgi:hypothetical protein